MGSRIARNFGFAFAFSVLCVTLALLSTSTSRADQCLGDCNGDGRVTVTDLITGINVELGRAPISACPSVDCGNILSCIPGSLLIGAVHNALYGCSPPTSGASSQ